MSISRTRVVVGLLVALLVVAPLVAGLYHRHSATSDTNCPVCHFNHQPMDTPLECQRVPTLDVVLDTPAPMETRVVAALDVEPRPSRAPPTA